MYSALVLKAAMFAATAHSAQRRKDTAATPYINHLIEVADLLASWGMPEVVVVAGLLHDIFEDTKVSPSDLHRSFGNEVLRIVTEMTDDKTLPSAERKNGQVEKAPGLSQAAAAVKTADKVANCRDIRFNPPREWSAQRVEEYFRWSLKVVGRLPERVGLDGEPVHPDWEELLLPVLP